MLSSLKDSIKVLKSDSESITLTFALFSTRGYGDLQTNFTMQFPPRTGHVYHIPTFSIVDTANNAMWETKLRDSKIILKIPILYLSFCLSVQSKKASYQKLLNSYSLV